MPWTVLLKLSCFVLRALCLELISWISFSTFCISPSRKICFAAPSLPFFVLTSISSVKFILIVLSLYVYDIATLNTKHESLSRTVQGIAATGGASTATNVTYNNDASGLNAENVQDAINELQNSKIDKTSILQEFGEADDKVISQKTISNKINNLLSNISEIDEIVNTAISDISTLKKKVDDIPATIPKVVSMSESDYDDLETKEPDTYYMLMEE